MRYLTTTYPSPNQQSTLAQIYLSLLSFLLALLPNMGPIMYKYTL